MRRMAQVEQYVSALIIVNMLILGLSFDVEPGWVGWTCIEGFFTALYTLEIPFKMWLMGWGKFWTAEEVSWNFLDVAVLLVAYFDLIVSISGSKGFALLRLVKLSRLIRLVRLLRMQAFRELKMMISGIFAGLRTLFWALVLFLGLVYCISLCLRAAIGEIPDRERLPAEAKELADSHAELFGDLLRTMFTVFRCFTDSCTSPQGTPLVPILWSAYGPLLLLGYVLMLFFIVFGVFNLFVAIFVEQTHESAKKDTRLSLKAREKENRRVAKNLQKLVLRFCGARPEPPRQPPLQRLQLALRRRFRALLKATGLGAAVTEEEELEREETAMAVANLTKPVTRTYFQQCMADPMVETLLDDINIKVMKRDGLFDALDADSSGSLEPKELIAGLMSLRGTSDRSDDVATLLGVRAVQRQLRDLHNLMMQSYKSIRKSESLLCDLVEPCDRTPARTVPP